MQQTRQGPRRRRMWRFLLLVTVGCAQVEQSQSCATYVACIQAQDEVKGDRFVRILTFREGLSTDQLRLDCTCMFARMRTGN